MRTSIFCLILAAAAHASAQSTKPAIESLSPSDTRAGRSDFILRVRGRNFSSMSVVRWNGSERVTAVIAPDLLSAMITAADVAKAGEGRISVFDPQGGLSSTVVLPVSPGVAGNGGGARVPNPVPVVMGFTPGAAAAGAKALTLTVRGRGFTPFSVVRYRGAPRRTRYVDPTTLSAVLLPGDLAKAGNAAISVRNPLPGGGVSLPMLLAIGADPGSHLDRPRIYPNPWREGVHDGLRISFENLASRSMIKIFTVTGGGVKTIRAGGGSGEWDLTDDSGRPVRPGAYVYLITDGKRTVEGKLKITR